MSQRIQESGWASKMSLGVLLVMFVSLFNRVQAQVPNLLIKATSATNVANSTARSTAIDASGNVYIAGSFSGTVTFGSTTLVSAGNLDIFLAKYDNTGAFQWAKRAGGVSADQAYGVAVSGSDVYITGLFTGTANFNTPSSPGSNEITSIGSTDIFLAKYDNTGTFQWAKRAGGTGADQAYGVAVSGSDVYITGHFFDTANFNTPSAPGSNEITSAGNRDIFLAKYDNTGAFQWAKRAGGTSADVALSIAVSGSDVYITGAIAGTANFNTPSASGSNEIASAGFGDIFLAKYDNTGTFQWAKRAGGTSDDVALGVAVSGSDVYITGYIQSTTANFNTPSSPGSNEIVSAGDLDIFLAKYDNTGTWQWAKRAGGTGTDQAQGVMVSGSDVYITGYFNSTANFNTPSAQGSNEITSAGDRDIFLAKYDNTGTLQWAIRAGGIGMDEANGVAVSGSDVYITGFFRGTANFNTPSVTGSNELTTVATTGDAFIARYVPCPTLIVSAPTAGSISLQGGSTTLSVTASNGVAPYQYSLNGGTFQNSNSFYVPAGLYKVTVKDANGCTGTSSTLYISDGTPPITCPPTIRIEFNQLTSDGRALPDVTGVLKTFIQANNVTYTDRLFNINCGTITGGNLNFNPTLGTDAIMALTRTFSANNTGSITYSCTQDIYVGAPKLSNVVFPADQTLPCADSRTEPTDTSINRFIVLGTGYPTISGQVLGEGLVKNLTQTYTDERITNPNGFTIKRTWVAKNVCTGETRTFVQNLTYRSNAGTCPSTTTFISGKIQREDLMDVPAKVNVYNAANDLLNNTTSPTFSFNNLLVNNNYRITAERPNTDWTNGVTTFDVALISRHVLGIAPLTSPYQIIAADANKNGEVEATDMLQLQRLILRLDNQLPSNNSWRFVPKNYQFLDPKNPFASDFPEMLNVTNLTTAISNGDFVAIKVGDVNNSLGTTTIRGGVESYKLLVEDKLLEKNKTYEIPVRVNASATALQYALNVDKNTAQIVNIAKGDLPNCTDNNFGLFKNENTITAVWTRSPNQKFDADETFTMVNLVIKPTQTVRLSEILSINPVYTEGAAYDEVGKGVPVKLSFGNTSKVTEGIALYQNHPNPFKDETTISFKLPEDAQARLTITSVDGKLVKEVKGDFKAGLNTVVVRKSELSTSGVFYYRLETADFSATKKMVIME